MKKNIKYTLVALLAVFGLASCDKNDYEYQPGTWDAAAGYSKVQFAESNVSMSVEPTEGTVATFTVTRANKQGECKVPFVVYSNTDNALTYTEPVFADGDSVATFTVDYSKAEIGRPYSLTLGITDPSCVSSYDKGVVFNFSVNRVKWNNVGYMLDNKGNKVEGWCAMTDDWLTTFFNTGNPTWPVQVQERDDMPGLFRVINPYCENFPYNEPGDFDADNDYYLYIDATNPEAVYIPELTETGMDWGYGMFNIWSMAGYYLSKNRPSDADPYFGKYENGAITFPKNGLMIMMADYNDGGLYQANKDGKWTIVIDPSKVVQPPYEATIEDDFDWEEVFTGDFKSGILGYTNTNTTLYKGVCTNKTDNCDVRFEETYGTPYTIAAPYAEDYNLVFCVQNGKIIVPTDYESQAIGIQAMGKDVYAIINAKESVFTEKSITLNITFTNEDGSIEYGTSNEVISNITYTTIGTADWTYTIFFTDVDEEGNKAPSVDPALELQQRDDDPTQYRLLHWGYNVTLNFSIDKDGQVSVPEQESGYAHPSYGMIMVSDMNNYTDSKNYPSKMTEDGDYAIPVIYYVSAGNFGYGYEYLTLHPGVMPEPAAAKAKVAAKKDGVKTKKVKKSNLKKAERFVAKKGMGVKRMTSTNRTQVF